MNALRQYQPTSNRGGEEGNNFNYPISHYLLQWKDLWRNREDEFKSNSLLRPLPIRQYVQPGNEVWAWETIVESAPFDITIIIFQ